MFEALGAHPWAYPMLEVAHILGIALLLGNLILLELRVFGWGAGGCGVGRLGIWKLAGVPFWQWSVRCLPAVRAASLALCRLLRVSELGKSDRLCQESGRVVAPA